MRRLQCYNHLDKSLFARQSNFEVNFSGGVHSPYEDKPTAYKTNK